MELAFLLLRVVSSVNQYHPIMAPGIQPRLACVTGDLIIYPPVILPIRILFAFFSLAGGWIMYGILMRKREADGFTWEEQMRRDGPGEI